MFKFLKVFKKKKVILIKSNEEYEIEVKDSIKSDKESWMQRLLTDDQRDWINLIYPDLTLTWYEIANKLIFDKNDTWLNKTLGKIDYNKKQMAKTLNVRSAAQIYNRSLQGLITGQQEAHQQALQPQQGDSFLQHLGGRFLS